MTTEANTDMLEFIPFSENNIKDMREHLVQAHGLGTDFDIPGNAPAAFLKAIHRLLEIVEPIFRDVEILDADAVRYNRTYQNNVRDLLKAHVTTDPEYAEIEATLQKSSRSAWSYATSYVTYRRAFYVPHTHMILGELPTADSLSTKFQTAFAGLKKPLTAVEKKAFKELIDNDFAILSQDYGMRAMSLEQERIDEIRNKYTPLLGEATSLHGELNAIHSEYKAAKNELHKEYQAKIEALLGSRDQKIAVSGDMDLNEQRFNISVNVPAIKADIERAKADTSRDIFTGKATIDRERLAMHRAVMIAGIPESVREAAKLIPSATDIIADLQQNKVNRQLGK